MHQRPVQYCCALPKISNQFCLILECAGRYVYVFVCVCSVFVLISNRHKQSFIAPQHKPYLYITSRTLHTNKTVLRSRKSKETNLEVRRFCDLGMDNTTPKKTHMHRPSNIRTAKLCFGTLFPFCVLIIVLLFNLCHACISLVVSLRSLLVQ